MNFCSLILTFSIYYYRMGPINIPFDIQNEMDVTYTVVTSKENISWAYHSDRSEFSCNKMQNKYIGKYDHFKDRVSDDDFVYDDSGDEENEKCVEAKHYLCEAMSLDMFIKPETKKKKSGKSVSSTAETRFEKGSYIIIDKPEYISEIDNVVEQEMELKEAEIEEIVASDMFVVGQSSIVKTYKEFECKVNRDEISPEYLAKRFEQSYIEGKCMPRRFVIFNANFTHDGIIVSVRILKERIQITSINIRIMNISEDFILCLDELFQGDVFNFEFLINSCFPNDTSIIKISNTSEKTFGITAMDKSFKPNADIIRINDVCRELFSENNNSSAKLNHANIYTSICPICYSVDTLTCIDGCQHYACDVCWRTYINTKISSAHYTISCPQMECDHKVDNITILCFLDYRLISIFIQKYCELHIQHTSGRKFCPTRDCPMIAVCETSNSLEKLENIISNIPCVHCDCNLSWCFNCQNDDHWPSSCIANESYQILKKKEYNVMFDNYGRMNVTEVFYKTCPKCKNPIWKNGGCDHMSCLCGNNFCWRCLRPLLHHDVVKCESTGDVLVTLSGLDLIDGGSRKHHMQRKAIQFCAAAKQASNLKRFKIKGHQKMSNSIEIIMKKTITLLINGYTLLENLSVANSVCQSKHTSARILRFVDMFNFLLKLLQTSVDVKDLSMINIANVTKNIELVKSSLNDLGYIGIRKIN